MNLLERLREAQEAYDAARKEKRNAGSELMCRDEWAGDALPFTVALVEAAQRYEAVRQTPTASAIQRASAYEALRAALVSFAGSAPEETDG